MALDLPEHHAPGTAVNEGIYPTISSNDAVSSGGGICQGRVEWPRIYTFIAKTFRDA